ncbi:MAG TPA: GatB/YqeY domain-containing protein [Acidimicrobiia bacterium]|nr:GatB/YqeY domain-containing protein [Acidimicrobiia bacterium]HMC81546.1 GatB/YqeY domain-containing protein [Acidimicrobiia bacterium]HTC80948.1 GatB/YqeY domain-containing protein [Acidimicrobiia bacterium]
MLAERLRDDLTAAMKRRDELATSALRMALAGIKEAAVSGKEARDLDDDEIIKVLTKQVKKREEAAEAFRNAGRADRADRELAEREVLAAYLPAALSPEELEAIVNEVLAEGAFSGMAAMGPAMKAVTARVAGRADGKTVSALVRERLAG